MASLISKKKGNKLYYYVVESARVDGQPRIVQQTYLGTAEKVAALRGAGLDGIIVNLGREDAADLESVAATGAALRAAFS